MVRMTARVLAVALAVILVAPLVGQARLTKEDADRFQAKLVTIVEFGNRAPARPAKGTAAVAPRKTVLSDAEVNSYLRFHAADQIPAGLTEPTLTALGDGRIGGSAVVDLDAVRKQKQRGWLDPLGYLTGRLPLTAQGRLTTQNGVGRFELESAEISGVPVPKTLIQELLTYYSATPEDRDGINMDDPFELPSRIREIQVARGNATVIQ
jgi:hypothetical protein